MPTPLQKSSKMSKACRVNKVHRVFSLADMKYLKDGKRMPIYLQKHLGMKETFNACTGSVNDRMIKILPLSSIKIPAYSSPIRLSGWLCWGLLQTLRQGKNLRMP